MMVRVIYEVDGRKLTKRDIEKAIAEERAVIRWNWGNGCKEGSLLIFEDPDEADVELRTDTRGHCYSMREESWSELCTDLKDAMLAARGALIR